MCRQDNYTLSIKSFCETSRCNKDILNNCRQIPYTRPYALLTFLSKRLPHSHLTRKDKLPTRQLQTRINLNYRPLSKLSMDLKVMPKSYKGHKFILCIIDEVTNYLKTVPIYYSKKKR